MFRYRDMVLNTGFNFDNDELSELAGLECVEPTLTQQHQKEEADINTIVRRFGVTGQLPDDIRPVMFADFEDVFDFRTAMDAINVAERSFMSMDADTRARFGNDPQRFVEFCSDSKNLEEMVRMGLAVEKPKPEPEKVMKVEVVEKEGAKPPPK